MKVRVIHGRIRYNGNRYFAGDEFDIRQKDEAEFVPLIGVMVEVVPEPAPKQEVAEEPPKPAEKSTAKSTGNKNRRKKGGDQSEDESLPTGIDPSDSIVR